MFSTHKKARQVCMRRKRILTCKSSPKTNLILPISRIVIQILIQDSFESSLSNWHRTRMWNVIATHQRSRYLLNDDKEKKNKLYINSMWMKCFHKKSKIRYIFLKIYIIIGWTTFWQKIAHIFFLFWDNLWRHDISIFQNYFYK